MTHSPFTGLSARRVTLLTAALLLLSPAVGAAQETPVRTGPRSDTIPSDTYRDPGARDMIERARRARGSEAEGLASYEATMTERVYVGITAGAFRRERGLYVSERVARVRWSDEGKETYRWLARRSEVPMLGPAVDVDEDCEAGEAGLCTADTEDLMPLDPGGDRLLFGGEAFLHPLADSAALHYHYASGDTMRIVLPSSGREIALVQVRLEPRRADFDLLAGALWFDLESAALVRGAFRPARDFNLDLDEPDDAEEVPGFLKPITASVDHMIVDYALQELRWWLPWRVRFEGVGRAGALLRVPVTVEILVRDFALNEADTLDIASADLPPGWARHVAQRETDHGEKIEEVYIVPPLDSLRASELLSEDFFAGEPLNFERAELDRMRRVLDETAVAGSPALPSISGLAAFRYNRVEALSAGVRHRGPVSSSISGWMELRLGAGDRVPNVEAGLRKALPGGSVRVAAYHRLQAATDWGEALNLESSANALMFGYDFGEYYRAAGVSVDLERESGRVRTELRAFAEAQRAEEKHTDISLAGLLGREDAPDNIAADEIEIAGLWGRLRAQWGVDPAGWIWTGTTWGEAGIGGAEYGRIAAGLTAAHPLVWRLTASLQGSIGTTFGDVPVQRLYYVAGPQVLRAFEVGHVAGESFWQARAELAVGYPAVRFVGFGDVAWAGERDRFGETGHAVAVGAGVSALDGLLRLDLARGVHGPGSLRWQAHLYLDALL